MDSDRELEMKSSAVTLSDMEVFIFPELVYGLVLANIMSPRIWRWSDDPWFEGLERMKPYRRISRLKQYIMDHYMFNLDLDTWGLTTKERELARFDGFIDKDVLARSNALFGYEGDQYYFDIDIRTHFGLDKYEGNVIPYWKTETVEAMDAFQYRPGYDRGAGECVSLATLYAAALFIVAGIPLNDIYLMATPLHSQNFIDLDDGILTNNRRLVTKNMWFNGSALSGQARRALENENVTIVAHETGYVHTVYETATMSAAAYRHFSDRLCDYLKTGLSEDVLCNFLRHDKTIQKCFQLRWTVDGVDRYIPMERVMVYEENCPYRIEDNTRAKLMDEIEAEEFYPVPLKSRIVLNELESFIESSTIDLSRQDDLQRLMGQFSSDCLSAEIAIMALKKFCETKPRLPNAAEKEFRDSEAPLNLDPDMTRDEIIERLESLRDRNVAANMAFYAYRDLNRVDPEPYLKACLERNPVSVEAARDMDEDTVVGMVRGFEEVSIYDGPGRFAQPDEVWNYRRGDGIEKAVLLANIFKARGEDVSIESNPSKAVLRAAKKTFEFASSKNIEISARKSV